MLQDSTGTSAGIGTFTPAGGGGFSVAGELSGLLQSSPEYRKVLDLYAPQYEGRNGIYGAIGSFGTTLDPAVMSQRFPTQEAARAAAQQLMAGVTPDKFSEAIVQGAPQYMSQFKDSSESDDFFGMHSDTLVKGILGVIGGSVAGGLGAGPTGTGAAAGGFSSAAMGGNVQDVLRSTATGAAAGYLGGQLGDAINGASTANPYGAGSGWGQDTLTNMGYTPAEIAAMQSGGIESLTNGVNPNAFDAGYNTGDINYGGDPVNTQPGSPVQSGLNGDPVSDYITKGGASDMSAATPGEGGYPEATYGGVEQLGQYNGAPPITPNFPEQSVPVTSTKIPPTPTTPTLNPSTGIGALVPNLPTGQNPPAQNIKVPDVPEYKMPDQAAPKNDLEKFWDWAKANPKLAMQLFGLGAAAFKGGSNSSGGTGGPGTGPQSGMTSTPAAPLDRHYVAPPAGYRPGFDPEWQYFQSGPAPAGTSTTQPVQGKVGIASVSNTPTFTSGSAIGSSAAPRPYDAPEAMNGTYNPSMGPVGNYSDIGSPSVNQPYTPGPNNNMDLNGQPLTPAPVPTFSGVGAGSPPPANVPQQAAPMYTPEQLALANAYKTHLGFADGAGAGVSTEDALARLANEQRRFDLFGNDSTSLFKNNPALYAAYKSGNAGAFTSALGPQQNNASAAYRYTGDAASAAAGQAEMAKLDAQKAAEVAATQPGGPMFGGVGSLPK